MQEHDYNLNRQPRQGRRNGRVVSPCKPPRRIENLRKDRRGRIDSNGWTEGKRGRNRLRLDELRPFIETGVTITAPWNATPAQLKALSKCCRDFCKEKKIPAYCVWEGPGKHCHIALGLEYDAGLARKWVVRLRRFWRSKFSQEMKGDNYLWNPEVDPEKIASYLSKTWDYHFGGRLMVKAAFPWLTFPPVWEVGFRSLAPRKKRVKSHDDSGKSVSSPEPSISPAAGEAPEKEGEFLAGEAPEKEGHSLFPDYTVSTAGEVSENEGDSPEAESSTAEGRVTDTLAEADANSFEASLADLMETSSPVDLWEASPLRLEAESVEDLVSYLPASMQRIVLPLESGIPQALRLHLNGSLLLVYTDRSRLVCLTSYGTGEPIEREALKHASTRPVYYCRPIPPPLPAVPLAAHGRPVPASPYRKAHSPPALLSS